MKRTLIVLVLAAAAAIGAAPQYWIPASLGSAPAWLRLGPSLAVTNGQLDVVAPAAAKQRVYDQPLVYDPVMLGWPLPANANTATFVVRVNGISYARGRGNWEIAKPNLTGPPVIRALADNMRPEFEVVIDYDPN